MQALPRGRFKVDLAGLQALCASNYAAVHRLLPQLRDGAAGHFVVRALAGQDIGVRILERAPYTTLIEIGNVEAAGSATPIPRFQVRVYHDARMAEVVACQGHRYFKPRYDYPNAQMYQRDEKLQLNRFLGEWLRACLANGRLVKSDALQS